MRTMLALLILLIAMPARAGELRAGAAAVRITPAPGTPMAGYYTPRAAEGVHDDLFAKALVLDVDGTRAALVALDLISTTRDLVEEARREVERTTGLRGDAVMISATHAHTGPVLSGRGLKESVVGGDSEPARRFRAELPAKVADSVRQAIARLTPAKALAGLGHEPSIAFNRRYHMRDGSVGWNPGKLNPRILKAAGTIDADVPVVYFESAAGKPLATYINYAVHLDNVGGPMISADMPFTLGRLLAEFKGPEMVTLFTAGCCGDVNHIDVGWREPQKGFENAARMGVILAAEVFRTWPRLEPVGDGLLRTRSVTVTLPLPKLEPGDVERARAIAARHKAGGKDQPKFMDSVWAYKVLDVSAREGRPHEVEVQAVVLGDELAWVSLPGEIFVELGLAIKQDSPYRRTIIAELANGAIGYIPSRRAYAQGNYEVVSARCAEGSGELLVDSAVRLLKDMNAAGTRTEGTPGRTRTSGP